MKVAIPVWNNYVSTAFDFAGRLLLVEIDNGQEIGRAEVPFDAEAIPQKALALKSLGADVLICGAISRALAQMVTASGIQVLPFVTGRIDDVLQAYLTGRLAQPQFAMPGCWPGARNGFRRCGRWCRRRRGRP